MALFYKPHDEIVRQRGGNRMFTCYLFTINPTKKVSLTKNSTTSSKLSGSGKCYSFSKMWRVLS